MSDEVINPDPDLVEESEEGDLASSVEVTDGTPAMPVIEP
jgi:hypothetical protein